MKTSEQITELAAALALAQGEIMNAPTNAKNPHFQSEYADLGAIRDVVRVPLAKHGLSVIQMPRTQDGRVFLTTRLMHKSGQWMEDECELKLDKQTMQGLGSAITYMKRYALSAVTQVAEEDDDGNEAEKNEDNEKEEHKKDDKKNFIKKPASVVTPNAPASTVKPISPAVTPKKVSPLITDEQRAAIWTRLKNEMKLSDEQAKEYLITMSGKTSSKEMTDDDYVAIMMDLDDKLLGAFK